MSIGRRARFKSISINFAEYAKHAEVLVAVCLRLETFDTFVTQFEGTAHIKIVIHACYLHATFAASDMPPSPFRLSQA